MYLGFHILVPHKAFSGKSFGGFKLHVIRLILSSLTDTWVPVVEFKLFLMTILITVNTKQYEQSVYHIRDLYEPTEKKKTYCSDVDVSVKLFP